MDKNDKRKSKKIKKLIAICSLSSFIFIVATYAWFIGMRQVNVASFEIDIASTDSLLLSLDGSTWDTTVKINGDNFRTVSYTNNVNNWAGVGPGSTVPGLKPISSIGEIDTTSSTMKMFEKASLTATPGGYRLLASRIHNYEQTAGAKNAGGYNTENGGYIAFDLFIRNFSGQAYYADDNIYKEEAIYLTTDSEVTVGSTGVENTGIENSVRVAFAQIGRVNGRTTDVATITGIKCLPDGEHNVVEGNPVTGICRTAQIWEPNDTEHVAAAISYYNTSCRPRPAAVSPATDPTDIKEASSYTLNGTCSTIANNNAYSTYAIGREIAIADKVDVYDGEDYNGYEATTRTTYNGVQPLYDFDYFTDTERDLAGMARPTFMTLAPNSITKVRVYVWIEGQDIDNYDFSSIGKQIKVAFGFTKERFTEEEAQGQDGPNMPTGDTIKPVFAGVSATKSLTTAQAATYDPMAGVTVSDIGAETTSEACEANAGTWGAVSPRCIYTAGTNAGTVGSEATSEACAANTTDGGTWTTGICYVDGVAGVQTTSSACDDANGTWLTNACTYDLTTKVQVTNPIPNPATAGSYVVRYLVRDWQGNYAEAFTTVTVSGS